jgi:hypothetical protein
MLGKDVALFVWFTSDFVHRGFKIIVFVPNFLAWITRFSLDLALLPIKEHFLQLLSKLELAIEP